MNFLLLRCYLSCSLHAFEFSLVDDNGLALQALHCLIADVTQLILSEGGDTSGIIIFVSVAYKLNEFVSLIITVRDRYIIK
jgi:hypothetical protein